jgi:hypothetical protein
MGMEFDKAPVASSVPVALTVQFVSGVNRLVEVNQA